MAEPAAPDRPFFAPRDDLPEPGAPRKRPRWPWAAAAVVVLAFVGVLLLLSAGQDEREAKDRTAARARVAELRKVITRQQAPKHGAAPALKPPAGATPAVRRAARAALVDWVEGAIVRDAQARADAGELDKRPTSAECGPQLKSKEAIPDDRVLSKDIGRYDCVAVLRDIPTVGGASVGRLGFAFVAALDFRDFTYTWCRNNPAQGERGEALVFVRLERACLAAKGRALGTGYVDAGGER